MTERDAPRKGRPPSILYHYTDSAGLLGIIESGGLWGTDLGCLNDTSELDYGLAMVSSFIAETACDWRENHFSGAYPFDFSFGYSIDDDTSLLRDHIGGFRDSSFSGVTCFCEDGDILGQWRGYGGAGGYALGFRSTSLQSIVGEMEVPLRPVMYEPLQQHQLIETLLTEHVASAQIDYEAFFLALREEGLWKQIFGVAAQLKNPAFKAEQEWRIAEIGLTKGSHGRLRFRSSPQGITPFVEFDLSAELGRLPLERVIVGPGGNSIQRIRTVKAVLAAKGYDPAEVAVQASTVPFRDV